MNIIELFTNPTDDKWIERVIFLYLNLVIMGRIVVDFFHFSIYTTTTTNINI